MEPRETARRLRLLADKLRTVTEGFNMRVWCSLPEYYEGEYDEGLDELVVRRDFQLNGPPSAAEPVCGTAACALGWATTIPELDLHLVRKMYGFSGYIIEVAYIPPGLGTPSPVAFEAAEHAFGITHPEALNLFSPRAVFGAPEPKAAVIDNLLRLASEYDARMGSPGA